MEAACGSGRVPGVSHRRHHCEQGSRESRPRSRVVAPALGFSRVAQKQTTLSLGCTDRGLSARKRNSWGSEIRLTHEFPLIVPPHAVTIHSGSMRSFRRFAGLWILWCTGNVMFELPDQKLFVSDDSFHHIPD